MSEDAFHITEEGAPDLLQEGEQPAEPASAQLGLAQAGWTPEEAARLMASIYTTGILIAFAGRKGRLPSVEEWPLLAAQPAEFPGSGQACVPFLDRFLPKDQGGGIAAIGVGALSIAGEVGMATGRRAYLLRKEDGRPRPAAGPVGATPAGSGAPPPAAEDDGGVFHFDDQAAEILNTRMRNDSYGDMGMGVGSAA